MLLSTPIYIVHILSHHQLATKNRTIRIRIVLLLQRILRSVLMFAAMVQIIIKRSSYILLPYQHR